MWGSILVVVLWALIATSVVDVDARGGSRGRSGGSRAYKVGYGGRAPPTYAKCTFRFYADRVYRGQFGTYDSDHPTMGANSGKLTSFYKYGGDDCCVILYKQPNYGDRGTQVCHSIEDLSLYAGFNDAVKSFKIGKKRASKPSVAWTMTSGWCLDCNGRDQNTGTISETWVSREACLMKCKAHSGAKACEHADYKNTCTIHTRAVSKGNGNGGYKCWALETNCKALGRVAYVVDNKDCWSHCGSKGGRCDGFCKSGGYCCRKGWAGCPADMNAVAPGFHTCIQYRQG